MYLYNMGSGNLVVSLHATAACLANYPRKRCKREVGDALQEGELQTILTDHVPTGLTLSALYPRHQHLSVKTRLFVELLEQRFGDRPYWDLVE